MCKLISGKLNARKGIDVLDSPYGGFVVTAYDYDKTFLLADIIQAYFMVSSQSSECLCDEQSPGFNVVRDSLVFNRYDILDILNRCSSSSAGSLSSWLSEL